MWVYKGVEVRQWRMIISILTRIDTVDAERVNSIEDFSASPIPNPPKLLPVGTKVRVFEEYNSRFLDKSKDYIIAGKIDKHATYYISDDWYMWDDEELVVPARAVVPVLE